MKNSHSILIISLLVIIIAYLVYRDFINPTPIQQKEVIVTYGVPELIIPDTVLFAGERVPLEMPDVKERLDREFGVVPAHAEVGGGVVDRGAFVLHLGRLARHAEAVQEPRWHVELPEVLGAELGRHVPAERG